MSDWKYSKEYQQATEAEQNMLKILSDILFDVQYAKLGNKAAARRSAALQILDGIQQAYKIHTTKKL